MPSYFETVDIDHAYYETDTFYLTRREPKIMTPARGPAVSSVSSAREPESRPSPAGRRSVGSDAPGLGSTTATADDDQVRAEKESPTHPPGGHSRSGANRKTLKHVDRYVDRRGVERHYYRRGHGRRIALLGTPDTAEFETSYATAEFTTRQAFLRMIKREAESGTVGLLVRRYLAGKSLDQLNAATRRAHERVLNGWVTADRMERCKVADLSPQHMRSVMKRRTTMPAAANDLLRKISQLMQFAVDHRWRADDPTQQVPLFARGAGRRAWTPSECRAFQARWPVSTTAGMAFVLLVKTGKRAKDVVRLTETDLDSESYRIDREQCTGLVLSQTALVLTTARGKPFTAHGFVNFFAAAIRAAKLPPNCVAGGLRKSRQILEATAAAVPKKSEMHATQNVPHNTRSQSHVPA